MEITQTLYVTDRGKWRSWLEENYDSQDEIWLIYYKKHSGRPRIPYDDAVEEAICFGWIDSIIQKIDEEKFAQKFTPRKNTRKWSDANKKRVKKMIRQSRMTEAGLAKIHESVDLEASESRPELEIPPEFQEALEANDKAREFFNNLAPSYRRQYIGWISSGKRAETRRKRVKEAIELLEQNKKLGMK
jgi:uncharacterized protein YdeI (YjbR/CyaY-like superfamily)